MDKINTCGTIHCPDPKAQQHIIMSESDILDPIAYFSDIENLVPFERAMFEDFNLKNRTNIFLLFMSISQL